MTKITGFAFHCHHDTLCEWVTDYDERVAYIKSYKPTDEQELRLRLFRMIPPDRLPKELVKMGDASSKAGDAFNKAWDTFSKVQDVYSKVRDVFNKAQDAYSKAWDVFNKAWDAYEEEIESLHKDLCPDCTWDGHTIFSKKGAQ